MSHVGQLVPNIENTNLKNLTYSRDAYAYKWPKTSKVSRFQAMTH